MLGKWLHCLLYWLGCIRVYWSCDIHGTGLLISKRFFNLRGWRKTFPSSRKSSPRAWNVLYILDIFPIMTTPHFAGPHQRPIRTFRDHAGHRRISSGAIRLTILGRRWRWPYSGRNLFQFPTVYNVNRCRLVKYREDVSLGHDGCIPPRSVGLPWFIDLSRRDSLHESAC